MQRCRVAGPAAETQRDSLKSADPRVRQPRKRLYVTGNPIASDSCWPQGLPPYSSTAARCQSPDIGLSPRALLYPINQNE